jgi:glycosyltransferase involved in cell wall biosynthesis
VSSQDGRADIATSPCRDDALPTRIGINAIFLLSGMGGLETYVRELIPELLNAAPPTVRFSVFCSGAGHDTLLDAPWAGAVQFITHPLLGVPGLKALTELTLLGTIAGRRVELLHSVALTAPLHTRAVNVVTIADVTWLSGPAPDLTTRLWRIIVPPVARRADRVIAISRASADEIVADLGVSADRVDLTLLGHGTTRIAEPRAAADLRRKYELGSGPVVLNVGNRRPHKNQLRLVSAMPLVLRASPDATLVLAGSATAHEQRIHHEIDALGLTARVRVLPFVDAADLEGLYAAATCFVLPSLTEGFGLPVLEAMAREVPVACSNTASLPEVAGDAARYFDPTDVEQIAAAVIELLGSGALRDELRARGLVRARTLTWRATAEATLSSYARAWREREPRTRSVA